VLPHWTRKSECEYIPGCGLRLLIAMPLPIKTIKWQFIHLAVNTCNKPFFATCQPVIFAQKFYVDGQATIAQEKTVICHF